MSAPAQGTTEKIMKAKTRATVTRTVMCSPVSAGGSSAPRRRLRLLPVPGQEAAQGAAGVRAHPARVADDVRDGDRGQHHPHAKRSAMPSPREISAAEEATPVANGLTVEHSTPTPAPRMIVPVATSRSKPSASISGTISP